MNSPVVKMKMMVIPQVLRMMPLLRRVMAVETFLTTNCNDVPVLIWSSNISFDEAFL